MTIYGVSQSSGVERQLKVERGIDGLVLTIIDHVGRKEQQRISVQSDNLVAAITNAAAGGSTVEGTSPPQGAKMSLGIEVRRNEVLLSMRNGSGEESDVAVGLDDLQDALEGVINRG